MRQPSERSDGPPRPGNGGLVQELAGHLTADLARELAPAPSSDQRELEWLQWMRRLGRDDIAAAACTRPQDHLESFVASLVPMLTGPFVVYGAGVVGRRIASLCVSHGRPPTALLETSPGDDTTVDGLPVWTPQEACAAGIDVVILGTCASEATMHAVLADTYGDAHDVLRCVSPADVYGHAAPGALDARLGAAIDVVACGRSLSEYLWLVRHADERMDAAVPVNADARRVFHVDRYRFAAKLAHGRRVLDCASGTGYGSGWLDRHASPASVLGVELDDEAVAYATRHYGSATASFRQGDACRLDVLHPASRDLIVSFETIEHVADDEEMLRGFARLLTPDGVLVTSTPNDWPIETSPHHVRSYDAAGFEAVLRRWFDDVTLFAQIVPSEQERGGVVPWRGQSRTEAECLVAVCRSPRRH